MSLRQRPESFRIDCTSPLARGLVFAGLGALHGSTHYHDSSLHGNAGTLTNMVPADDWVWIDELGRWGLEFDDNDYITCGSNMSLFPRSGVTHSTWIKLAATATFNRITSFGKTGLSEPYLSFGLRGYNYWAIAGSPGGTYTETITGVSVDTALHHIAATYDGTTLAFYLDGASIYSSGVAWSGALPDVVSWSRRASIGSESYYSRFCAGRFIDPVIHSRALTTAEIAILANPADPMLGGLVLPPKRKLYAVRSTVYSRHYFLLQSNLGKSLLRLTS